MMRFTPVYAGVLHFIILRYNRGMLFNKKRSLHFYAGSYKGGFHFCRYTNRRHIVSHCCVFHCCDAGRFDRSTSSVVVVAHHCLTVLFWALRI